MSIVGLLFWFLRAFGMVYFRRFFVVYFVWIFKVMGSRLSCPESHVYYAVCHFLLSGITETQNSFFIIENTEVIEDSFFVFLRHRVLLETGLIKNGPLRSLTISS